MRVRRIELPASANPILRSTYPIPAKWTFDSDECIYVNGGFTYGARYPDIIINEGDYERVPHLRKSEINNFVRKRFDSANLNPINYQYSFFLPWTLLLKKSTLEMRKTIRRRLSHLQFDRRDLRRRQRRFKCKTQKQCKAKAAAADNSFTNITALCHGDCREIAWYATFLYNANTKGAYYVCYATLYVDMNGHICKIMDHVFGIREHNCTLTAVDTLFDKVVSPNCMVIHGSPIKTVNVPELGSALELGDIYVDGRKTHRLLAVPKIYDGRVHFIKRPEASVLVMGRPVDFDQVCDV